MSHLSCHLIPTIGADDATLEKFATRMRPLRLTSLEKDSHAFISRAESEAVQPMSFWTGRLKEPTAYSIIMVKTPKEVGETSTEHLLHEDTEWVGFCVMIDTRIKSPTMAGRERNEQNLMVGDWYMAAVYLDASLRGRGAGKTIVQFGLDLIRKNITRQGETCCTGVMRGNELALGLYKSLGFEITDADAIEVKEGKSYKCYGLTLKF